MCVKILRVRRPRGNIIITALFVAIFLFFLSVALVWTNRQDIALVLSMEHKMKAEVAARSGAMYVYGALRANGTSPHLKGALKSGADWRAQLVRLRPEGRRGGVLLLRSRGTSGPVSTYFTLHLLETELSSPNQSDNRLLVFPRVSANPTDKEEPETTERIPTRVSGSPSGSSSVERPKEPESTDPESSKPSPTTVLPPDFVPQPAPLGLPNKGSVAASDGPIFASEKATTVEDALSVVDTIPVFTSSGGAPLAFGPALITVEGPTDQTEIRVLRKKGDAYEWEAITAPTNLADNPSDRSSTAPVGRIDLTGIGTEWKAITIRSLDGQGSALAQNSLDSSESTSLASFGAEGGEDWKLGSTAPIRAVSLRGAIAAQGEEVYSHAWQYVYLRFRGGSVVPPLRGQDGSRVLRWPCVVRYEPSTKRWSFAWNPLKDNGELTSREVPDPSRLWVDPQGSLYALNEANTNELLKLNSNGGVSSKGVVRNGRAVIYKGKVYTPSNDPSRPGLAAVGEGEFIDFKTLPDRIPAIAGPIIPPPPPQILDSGPTVVHVSELNVSELSTGGQPTQVRTVLPRFDISYTISPETGLAAAGEDLYLNLQPKVEPYEPDSDAKFFGNFELGNPVTKTLARYDGKRWHILPHGAMAALQGGADLNSPGDQILCARYADLPQRRNRYTVISISTDPFEFQQ